MTRLNAGMSGSRMEDMPLPQEEKKIARRAA
jgi:hypothetical protein